MDSKTCTKCGERKPLSDYYYRKDRDTYTPSCKDCVRKRRLDYYYRNREVELDRFKQRYADNIEERRELSRQYYERTAEQAKARAARYRRENAEWKREYDRKYAKENPEIKRKARRKWAQNNPVKARIINIRKRKRRAGARGDFTAEQWKALVEHYCPNGRCLSCREKKKLTVDHVVALANGGTNYIENTQPICRACNGGKRDKTIDFRPDNGAFAKSLRVVRDA